MLNLIWIGFIVIGFVAALAQALQGDVEVFSRVLSGLFDSAKTVHIRRPSVLRSRPLSPAIPGRVCCPGRGKRFDCAHHLRPRPHKARPRSRTPNLPYKPTALQPRYHDCHVSAALPPDGRVLRPTAQPAQRFSREEPRASSRLAPRPHVAGSAPHRAS